MSRVIVISNRVAMPREHRPGGLALAMRAALRETGGVWFGWNGRIEERTAREVAIETSQGITYATIGLGRDDHDQYYLGFANRTLWPLFHFRPGLVDFTRSTYDTYVRVNALLAERVAPLVRPDDLLWVHDYHLIPLGAQLRRLGVRTRMGFFLHTPFPPAELLTMLPVHLELFEALSAYDLVGFHTPAYLRAFRDYIATEVGGEMNDFGMISVRGGRRSFRAGVFPIGIDVAEVARQSETASAHQNIRLLRESLVDRALIIGVDRLDYSKGLVERAQTYAHMLRQTPALRRRVVFMQIAPPSRTDVPEYRRMRRELERLAGSINGEFADADWVPMRYVNKSYPHATLTGYYRVARVGLVTPLRDGMNLVAKEYVASQDPEDPGVLVLSRFAGAAHELRGALLVNPHDIDGTAACLRAALHLPLADRRARWEEMMRVLRSNDLTAWRRGFVGALTSQLQPFPAVAVDEDAVPLAVAGSGA